MTEMEVGSIITSTGYEYQADDNVHAIVNSGLRYGHSHKLCLPQCFCYPYCQERNNG